MTHIERQQRRILECIIDNLKYKIVKHKRAREFKKGEQVIVCELMHITAQGNGEFVMDDVPFHRHPFSSLPVLDIVPESLDKQKEFLELFNSLEEDKDTIYELEQQLAFVTKERDYLQSLVNSLKRTETQKEEDKQKMTAFLSGKFI